MPQAPVLRGQLIRAKADVLLVGDGAAREEIHSVLLMTLSPYFHTILECCDLKPVRIYGADKEVLRIIKEYAYEGKITGLSEDNLEKIYGVADMYNIIGILDECALFERVSQLKMDTSRMIDQQPASSSNSNST